ncbi:class I SAM-dependent methyltransferase [Thiorhodovibrio litoralis]|uniref:class I SAM-dependent methyltransferase n=1 Tax=Thiorhodovibrio litoralis TaxID=2952932 RepID=UPI002B25D61B|nr:class I SAM-dependent methyltransferase [Thiorhodovibrio litoralis]
MKEQPNLSSNKTQLSVMFHDAAKHHRAGRTQEALGIYHAILRIKPNHAEANHNLALLADGIGQTEVALQFFEAAVRANPQELHFWKSYLEILTRYGRIKQAESQLEAARAAGINESGLQELATTINQTMQRENRTIYQHHLQMAQDRFPGMQYHEWLDWFHCSLKPTTYLEIGVESGQSLGQAQPPTKCIGIDPAPTINADLTAWTKIFSQSSDDFFHAHDVNELFGGEKFDLCFIDGYHSFDQALRDFINAEANAHENSVILLHDIFPLEEITASRERKTQFWTGDTWKIIPLLKEQRPDLSIVTIPTFPSGLAVVTNLDPKATAKNKEFSDLVDKWTSKDYRDYADTMPKHLNAIENEKTVVFSHLTRTLTKAIASC